MSRRESKFNIGHAITIGIVVLTVLGSTLVTWGAVQQEQDSQNEAIAGKADKEVVEVHIQAIKEDVAWLKNYLINQKPE